MKNFKPKAKAYWQYLVQYFKTVAKYIYYR